ncbi:hypothetical protein COU18_01625 [Candidatus Kaiserbacteria bacterium CG10_big_fil_rev_8_21_14_0_10_51_14]|uniref:Uncharacterized protein n=1 Tax=Candidatus Kaiserbacteria bacterium CG10_big_fil_rev_8_21_14_0_10_51_14 TaxID=1974610 RepID=A0A2H0UCG2_9BACT|nr:MAG: hypothetical protein COU18_01625 [Candidatus Kaiserbacteria bacterium CG10_big_fil_rev_8_21_14_0_10_51_14]
MRARIQKISRYTPSIFQGKFDFRGPRGISLSQEHPLERRMIQMLALVLIVSVAGYLYFISASVLNVIARKEALAHITAMQSAIGGLEQEYFALSQEVSPEAGSTLGLTPIRKTHYVYRPGNITSATIAQNAI